MEQIKEIIVFWGAGKIGKRALSFWQGCGLKVDYFCDNSSKLIGSKVNDVEVIAIEKFRELSQRALVFITCQDDQAIRKQLLDMGIEEKRIIGFNTIASMLEIISNQSGVELPLDKPECASGCDKPEILFDLSNGLVMGGVESWSIQTAHMLEQMGYTTALLVNNPPVIHETEIRVIRTFLEEDLTEWDKLRDLLGLFVGVNRTVLVCNFMGHFFVAACLAKKMFPEKVKVIAVVHSDADKYYQDCARMERYIDVCLVISERMKAGLQNNGFPMGKIAYLPWDIMCDRTFERTYSGNVEAIRIGYAGRIVVADKRVDLLIAVIKGLKQSGIEFVFELAGEGSYVNEFLQEVSELGCQEQVHLLGRLDRSQIRAFWKRQDIMISCSEHEGHSISQCEAMAAGAVPILTDVSGVRDDVIDGRNGFIVGIGAIEKIVENISYLYMHRELLPIMGEEAYQTIRRRHSKGSIEKLWKEILM